MSQIVIVGVSRPSGNFAATALRARGNVVITVDTPDDLVRHWEKSFASLTSG